MSKTKETQSELLFDKHWKRYNKILGGHELLLSIADLAMINKAMEEYSSQQLSEYREKLKADIEGMMPEEGSCDGDTVLMACKAELEKVLTLIDKIQ